MKNIVVKQISWEEIKEIWAVHLWPNRISSIDPISYMTFLKGVDMSIIQYSPTFWGKYIRGKLVGVNSGHKTNKKMYRSRGLWVDQEYRNKGIGSELLLKTLEQAFTEECESCWSFPRKTSWKVYKTVGFKKSSKWTMDGEYGPNCFCIKNLI